MVDGEALGLRGGEPDAGPPAGEPHVTEPEVTEEAAAGRPPLEIDVLTLFPAMLEGPLAESIPGRVQARGLAVDPRPRPAPLGSGPA